MMRINNKKRGFTLIELLAVIVILAVIALIAVPQILNILNKARKSAAEDTTSGIIKSAENYVTSFMLKNNGGFPDGTLTFECTTDGCILQTELKGYDIDNLTTLDFKGTKPNSGTITISNSGKNIQATNLNINNFTCNYLNDETYCGIREYNSGDPYTLGNYNWHVISDDGKYLTLLMDANQIKSLEHCTDKADETNNCGLVDINGTKYYQYSWDKSQIRTYLNGEFLTELENNIGTNKLMTTDICIDPAMGSTNEFFYGGYLKSEIDNLGVACHKGYVSDKVRLITVSEYYNISPYYKDVTLPYTGHVVEDKYDNIGKIPKLNLITKVTSNDWLDSFFWWTMTAFSGPLSSECRRAYRIVGTNSNFVGEMGASYGQGDGGEQIRPVITIIK